MYALFSGLEIAIVGTRRSKVMRLYRKKVSGSSALFKLKSNPSKMTSSVNLGNTLVNVASSVLAADVAIKLAGNQGIGIAIGIMTFVVLVFGEIFPKTYSHNNSEVIALRFSRFLLAFAYVMYPFVWFLEHLTKSFLKLIGGHSSPKPITEEDIHEVVDLGLSEKAIEKEEHALVRKALQFDDTPIVDVMTPKKHIFSLDDTSKLSDVISLIISKGFSRIPVYSKVLENIVGVLHIWDIAKIPEKEYKKTSIGMICRTPFFAYSSEKISNLLVDLKKNDSHMAVILDEDENFLGIVTIEDLLEEIVGDFHGEIG